MPTWKTENLAVTEGHTMNQILRGWAAQNVPDDELLRRGMDLIEGFYHSISRTPETLP